ncbi:unnamed protein product [Closterium sp. NIES-64]|nr:unnamed protein product [Closterium sp. NIES-64]
MIVSFPPSFPPFPFPIHPFTQFLTPFLPPRFSFLQFSLPHGFSSHEIATRAGKCDYSVGFWLRAPKGTGVPRYTARAGEKGHCPYVRPLYACERNNRPDSRYQRYRWHAKKCRLSYFSGSGFKYLMRQRRMLLVGDSIMGNLFEALLCAIHAAGYQGKTLQLPRSPYVPFFLPKAHRSWHATTLGYRGLSGRDLV